MGSQSATKTDVNWRRAAVGGVLSLGLAGSLVLGLGSSVALADPAAPADPTAQRAEISPDMTADQVLAIIDSEYDTGAGGGQLSNLIHSVLKLRSAGFKASEANRQQIIKALGYRPNQTPLISALETTLAYQTRQQSLMQQKPSNPTTIGINQSDPTNPGSSGFGVSGGGVNVPIG